MNENSFVWAVRHSVFTITCNIKAGFGAVTNFMADGAL